MLSRLLRPVVQLRDGEATTVLLMFLYSFLAMAGYNMIKPVTRGLFIEKLGAENLPWIQFGAGIVIGFIAVIAIKTGFNLYLDIAIALGLVGFLATVAFARFVERQGRRAEEEDAPVPQATPHGKKAGKKRMRR